MKIKNIFKFKLAAVVIGLMATLPVHASLIVTVGSVNAAAGSSSAFDVTLTNTGPSAVSLGGFSFGITTGDTDISFTSATTATVSPYIFGADSLFGPDLAGPSGQSLVTSDLDAIGDVSVGAGATLGLGHVIFAVAGGSAPGPVSITLLSSPAFTTLSDATGSPVTINTLTGGTLTVTSSVPEPSTWLSLAAGLFAVITLRRRRVVR
jgi:hypothetical protein